MFYRKLVLSLAFILLSSLANAACVTDDTGEKVCLDAPPKKAVSLYGAWSETLNELGAAGSIVARTKSDDTVPALAALPVVGTGLRPNAELVLALGPDIVVARGSKAGSEALTALRERGVKVAAFDPQTLPELYAVIEKLGSLWGKDAEAKALASKIAAAIASVKAEAAKTGKKPRVVFEVTSEPLTVAGSEGILAELIAAAGGVNVIAQPKRLVRIDPEALLAADPDVYIVQTGPMNAKPSPPAERALHAQLRAVREGRVYTVDEKTVSRPGPKVAEGAAELLKLFSK